MATIEPPVVAVGFYTEPFAEVPPSLSWLICSTVAWPPAPQRLGSLRTPDGLPIPPNTLNEMRRDLGRLAIVRGADYGD